MARNEEKAMSMLNRWLRVQSGEEGKKEERRPHLATLCETLPDCEKWRRQILKEITKSVGEIQNPGLGEFKIRDLNDAINKLIREKGHWEKRILELGGPNYARQSTNIVDADGNEVLASRGYRYFGAAKDLPGVRDLFRKSEVSVQKRTRSQMYKCADAAYFGFRDDDDAMLEPLEKVAEDEQVAAAVLEWTERQAKGGVEEDEDEEGDGKGFTAHVPVPSTEDIEKAVLEQKKKEMLARYASEELAQSIEQAKEISTSRKRGRE
mmetsp:Transcript_14375/g.33241  ORF Transcript_14375/g.33241 Transcript_14375/m.33241 type:complete len:265 (-) Transcript_14375:12-806(-)